MSADMIEYQILPLPPVGVCQVDHTSRNTRSPIVKASCHPTCRNCFPHFYGLPKELQLIVWKHTLPDVTVDNPLTVCMHMTIKPYYGSINQPLGIPDNAHEFCTSIDIIDIDQIPLVCHDTRELTKAWRNDPNWMEFPHRLGGEREKQGKIRVPEHTRVVLSNWDKFLEQSSADRYLLRA